MKHALDNRVFLALVFIIRDQVNKRTADERGMLELFKEYMKIEVPVHCNATLPLLQIRAGRFGTATGPDGGEMKLESGNS